MQYIPDYLLIPAYNAGINTDEDAIKMIHNIHDLNIYFKRFIFTCLSKSIFCEDASPASMKIFGVSRYQQVDTFLNRLKWCVFIKEKGKQFVLDFFSHPDTLVLLDNRIFPLLYPLFHKTMFVFYKFGFVFRNHISIWYHIQSYM